MSEVTYFTHKGILFPINICTRETLLYVENEFQLLDDDVVNVVYPKSGTNWMAEILCLIHHKGDPTWVQNVSLWDRTPWIETGTGMEHALKYPPPRLLNTHLPIQLFPKSILHSKAKIIYTARNPKDVLVSFYHFSKSQRYLKDPGTVEEFLEKFLNGKVTSGSWFDHVKGWMEMKDRANFFFITYEELKQDLRGSVERICHFLGKELNSQQIDSVVENASFHKMKDNKMSNLSLLPDTLMDHTKGKLMRKGICGDWKTHLTVAQSEHFDRVYQEKMRDVKMTFPWD
ncbi:sulfotransferase 2B1-like [Hemicordylus capensis]|uniref:sulfotransferase 2B1-like n=1 Tax=Hemicordylus capensis TaxID=884348 RepID=UPI0023040989|nr:sulfotransferase 2B1-like [Hemicordylus capensis]XP_053123997.1 sulfotransferase 2B1-like [Hemicordylus capensis]XP_053123998.1 sulfotransferase 2B1-like [Hemicordylus capensis]